MIITSDLFQYLINLHLLIILAVIAYINLYAFDFVTGSLFLLIMCILVLFNSIISQGFSLDQQALFQMDQLL